MTRKTPLTADEAEQQLQAIAYINTGVELLAQTLKEQGFDATPVCKPIWESYKESVNHIGQSMEPRNENLRYPHQAGTVELPQHIKRIN